MVLDRWTGREYEELTAAEDEAVVGCAEDGAWGISGMVAVRLGIWREREEVR